MSRKKQLKEPPPWMYERSMSPAAYKNAIKMLHMTQAGAGRFLGVSARTSRRYVSGDALIRAADAMLLRGMIHRGETPVVPKWSRDQH